MRDWLVKKKEDKSSSYAEQLLPLRLRESPQGKGPLPPELRPGVLPQGRNVAVGVVPVELGGA